MEQLSFPIGAELDQSRVDAAAAELTGRTRSQVQALIADGLVTVDGKPVQKNTRLKAGQELAISIPDPVELAAVPQDIPVDIVYEDESVIVVNKPKGMVVHPAPGNPDGTLVNALLWHCRGKLSSINGVIRPGIVHRIDPGYQRFAAGGKDRTGASLPVRADQGPQL